VFRHYIRITEPRPEVYSVDDDARWLDKTREFLHSRDLSVAHLFTWDDFLAQEQEQFDLVLHDLGKMDKRIRTLSSVLSLVGRDGMLILDDVHKKTYGAYVRTTLREAGYGFYDLSRYTKDRFGRFAMLAIHNDPPVEIDRQGSVG
jgi:predicted O-methyltransferase YrrM